MDNKLRARVSDAQATYRPLGGWVELPDDLQPALEGHVSADVIVVGAGFAGLSTALELAASGANVVVLEKDFAGFGASGRNAGYLVGGQGLEFELFTKRMGLEQAKQVVSFYQQSVTYVEAKLDEYQINCDYNGSGLISAGVHPSQEKKLRQSIEEGNRLGAPSQFLDSSQLRARGIPEAFLFGGYTTDGGTLDPGKYVMGLRRTALRAGVKIYENTALLSYDEGQVITCKTARGSASAAHLVLATNAYTPQLGLLKDKVAPLRVSAIETQPLTSAQLKSLGWPNREGIVTPHHVMESLRLTAGNTLLITTKHIDYVYGSRTPNVPDNVAYRELVQTLNDRFPSLRGVAIQSCWSGYISLAYDALPVVGEAGSQRNILYAAGCSGHALGAHSFIGKLLAQQIRGTAHPLFTALQHKTPSMLAEPLQWCVMKSALGAARLLDGRVNRKVRKSSA